MKKLKIAILTQPLGHNYGGLLQAYALQYFVKNIGCEVETLDRRIDKIENKSLKSFGKNIARLILGRIKSMPSETRTTRILSDLANFRDHNINLSPKLISEHSVREYCKNSDFDVYIVGSDQVWRPRYSPSILNFYLDFLDDIESTAKRIAYAASFGVENWEYSADLTKQCNILAKKFDVISVREDSALDLCREMLQTPASLVVDPTLLLDPTDYNSLLSVSSNDCYKGQVVSYVLDPAPEKRAIADIAGQILRSEVISIKPDLSYTQVKRKDFYKCKYPSVECWLRAFYDAGFIVTDSFHGTVFSILFNKPFVAIGNSARGMARFKSLLTQLGLTDRLVEHPSDISESLLNDDIDWATVNEKRVSLATKSRIFLKQSLLEG